MAINLSDEIAQLLEARMRSTGIDDPVRMIHAP